MQVRFYLRKLPGQSGFRSPDFPNSGFLEIKVKNAHPSEVGVSRKYRVELNDESLLQLFSLNPRSKNFKQDLEKVFRFSEGERRSLKAS